MANKVQREVSQKVQIDVPPGSKSVTMRFEKRYHTVKKRQGSKRGTTRFKEKYHRVQREVNEFEREVFQGKTKPPLGPNRSNKRNRWFSVGGKHRIQKEVKNSAYIE